MALRAFSLAPALSPAPSAASAVEIVAAPSARCFLSSAAAHRPAASVCSQWPVGMLKPETGREDPPALAQPLDAEFSWKEFHLSLVTQNGRQLELPPTHNPG